MIMKKHKKTLILTLDLVPEKSCSSSFIHPRSLGYRREIEYVVWKMIMNHELIDYLRGIIMTTYVDKRVLTLFMYASMLLVICVLMLCITNSRHRYFT